MKKFGENHKLLEDMYRDGFFSDFLADKIRDLLKKRSLFGNGRAGSVKACLVFGEAADLPEFFRQTTAIFRSVFREADNAYTVCTHYAFGKTLIMPPAKCLKKNCLSMRIDFVNSEKRRVKMTP